GQQLQILDGVEPQRAVRAFVGKLRKILPVRPLIVPERRLVRRVQALTRGLCLDGSGADFDAELAPRTVFDGNVNCIEGLGYFAPLSGRMFEGVGRLSDPILWVSFCADSGMRADHDTLAALYAQIRLPDRNFLRDIALFKGCRAERVSPVSRKG